MGGSNPAEGSTSAAERWTADVPDEGLVVFLIGMHVNRWRRLRSVWRVARWMPRLLRALVENPDLGLLGYRQFRAGRTILVLQYWRSAGDLHRFATDATLPHTAAWRDFNRQVAAGGDVGVFHETYRVAAADVESFYANVPALGLAAATGRQPIGRHADGFARRIAV